MLLGKPCLPARSSIAGRAFFIFYLLLPLLLTAFTPWGKAGLLPFQAVCLGLALLWLRTKGQGSILCLLGDSGRGLVWVLVGLSCLLGAVLLQNPQQGGLAVATLLLAPCVEELWFRQLLWRTDAPWASALLGSGVFVLLHANLGRLLSTAWLPSLEQLTVVALASLLLYALRYKTKTWLWGVLAHALYNSLIFQQDQLI